MSTITAESLRLEWKQVMADKDLPDGHSSGPRLHRVCKWLSEAQALLQEGRDDVGFIACWISWNALYARWDEDGQAERDFASLRTCIGELLQLDRDGFIEGWIYRDKPQIINVLCNPFLSHHFWREIGTCDDFIELGNHVDEGLAERLIKRQEWARLLEQLFGRLYVLRNQLVHGGATPGGRVNREQVQQGLMLERFMIAAIRAVIHGNNPWHDWGPLPYPVLEVDG